MTSHEHVLWHYVRELPSYYSKAEEKKEENNALQPRAWLICRKKRNNLFFSRKPPGKKGSRLRAVVFACLTETCAFWLRLPRLFVFYQRGCWGWRRRQWVSTDVSVWFVLDPSHAGSVRSNFYPPFPPSVSIWQSFNTCQNPTQIQENHICAQASHNTNAYIIQTNALTPWAQINM